MSDTRRPGEPAAEPDAAEPTAREGRPAWLLPVAIGVGVLVVVGVAIGVFASRGSDEAGPAPATSTVVAPLPTPAQDPVARGDQTAFTSALPSTVLQYALASSEPEPEWIGAGALEAYAETYTDGEGGTVALRVAQLETPQEATALLQQLVSALPAPADAPTDAPTEAPTDAASPGTDLPQSGDVTVGGSPVGTFTVVDAGDGTGIAVWQNGTAVFHLTAPVVDVLDVYRAYGL